MRETGTGLQMQNTHQKENTMTNNLSHETAKKLKEAGFPQNTRGTGGWYDDETGEPSPHMLLSSRRDHDLTKCSYVPSLTELIGACGEDFYALRHGQRSSKWYADAKRPSNKRIAEYKPPRPQYTREGSTPEEAVANLYLALHNK